MKIKIIRCLEKETEICYNEKNDRGQNMSEQNKHTQRPVPKNTAPRKSASEKSAPRKSPDLRQSEKVLLLLDQISTDFLLEESEFIRFLLDLFSGIPILCMYFFRMLRKKLRKRRRLRAERRQLSKEEKKARKTQEKQLKAEKRYIMTEKREKALKERRRFFKAMPLLLLCSLFLLELAYLAMEGGDYLYQYSSSAPSDLQMILVTGKNKSTVQIPASLAWSEETDLPYFDMTAVANSTELQTFGDEKNVRYTNDTGQTAFFEDRKTVGVLNGEYVAISSAARFYNGRVYLPLEFLTLYTSGLNIGYSPEKSTLTISKTQDSEQSTKDHPVYNGLSITKFCLTEAAHPTVED